jgi:hypothetical protein
MPLLAIRLFAVIMAVATAMTPAPPWTGLPTRTQTASHIPGDPVNIGFEGSRAMVIAAFARIGWVQADPLSLKDDMRLAEAAMFNKLYPQAPVSHLYLFKRPEDFAVERELGSVSRRDHARFWDTGRTDAKTHQELWIGDASRDVAIKVLYRHHVPIGTTHRIDPNIDVERDSIVHAMQANGVTAAVVNEQGMGATTNGRNGTGDRFSTDGIARVVVLAPSGG